MNLIQSYIRSVLLFVLIISFGKTFSQCTTKIGSFPYSEGFELTDGGWTAGGANQDWVWGTPAKSVISTAGTGVKCWIVGGLTGNSYADGEASWLQSPCFDFSSLKYPYISFQVFWDTEKNYDGAGFQYSTDAGLTWKDLGSISSVNNCLNYNWYNTEAVMYLSSLSNTQNGWSGAGQTGSGGWVTANHVLNELQGKTSVTFRFVFAAGTRNNNYNGFAIDEFRIMEAPSNKASFSFSCGNDNLINFTNTSSLCPTNFEWNFDDPLSGTNNISQLKDPSHQFMSTGKHSVFLIVGSPYNKPDTFKNVIQITGINTQITGPLKCFGDSDGEITANVTGTTDPVQYSWNTIPVQTGNVAKNLSDGSYTVTATSSATCPVMATVSIAAPAKISNTVNVHNPGCIYPSGEAQITTLGGTPPYSFSWNPTGGTNSTATNLPVGSYTVSVTDKNACADIVTFDIVRIIPPVIQASTLNNVTCFGGRNGSATVKISGGLPPYSIKWSTSPIQITDTATGLKAGNYTVIVEDQNNCKVSANSTVTEPVQINRTVSTTNATCGFSNGQITLGATGNYQYMWSPLISTGSTADNIGPGIYSVNISNPEGCTTEIKDIWIQNIGNPARPFLGKDTSICSGEKISVTPGLFETYLWQDNSVNPVFEIDKTGKYWVRVNTSEGCQASDTLTVTILEGCVDLYFPSSFSPNNDGLNETFGPTGNYNAVSHYELLIYDRWGELVFKTSNPRERWNGKIKNLTNALSTYVWFSSYEYSGQGKKFKKGSLILIK